jgi:hypothetical protein
MKKETVLIIFLGVCFVGAAIFMAYTLASIIENAGNYIQQNGIKDITHTIYYGNKNKGGK